MEMENESSIDAFGKLKNLTSKDPLGERVYRQVKRGIIEGLFSSGEPLPEDQLTKALGASRTPVREALMRLKHDGLVEINPRKGAKVLELSPKELDDLLESRMVFETAFFERAVKSLDRFELKKFRDHFGEAEKNLGNAVNNKALWEQERVKYLNVDFVFHRRIILATGNDFWIEAYNSILNKLMVYSHQTVLEFPDFFQQAMREHTDILNLLLSEDFSEAKWLLKRHITNFKRCLISGM